MSSALADTDERALLRRIAEGDEAAFAEIFGRYWDNIYSVALMLSKSETAAEDVVQEIFLKVWRKRAELPAIERFDNYLFILARNHIFSEFKKLKVRKDYAQRIREHFSELSPTPEEELLAKESAALVAEAVSSLPLQQQQVWRLSREKGLTHEEIATELGISPHTVRNHVVAAIKNIRKFLSSRDMGLATLIALFDAFL